MLYLEDSPWGEVQYCNEICPDVAVEVTTAGHGGVMIKEEETDWLTDEAMQKALYYDGFYCFEEDCDAPIAIYEMIQHGFYTFPADYYAYDFDHYYEVIKDNIRQWNPDYAATYGV